MPQKINIFEKHSEFGAQFPTVDASDMIIATDDEVESYVERGFWGFRLQGKAQGINYFKPTPDGLVRDVEREIEENGWNRKMKLFNICDQLTWAKNIQVYFDNLIQDEEFMSKIEVMCEKAINTPPKNGDAPFDLDDQFDDAKEYLKGLEAGKGKSGQRPSNIYDFLCKTRTGWFYRNMTAYENWNGFQVDSAKFPTWKSKVHWKKNK
jgi:hypothetical protein